MRISILLLPLVILPLLSRSGNITVEQAKQVAVNFYFERSNLSGNVLMSDISIKNTRACGNTETVYYVVDILPIGFVVVSGFDNVIPVLAYSFESNYAGESSIPDGFKVWMNHYEQQIEYAYLNNIFPSAQISQEWNRLLSKSFQVNPDSKLLPGVSPLLVSKWDQDTPYNNWCPADPAGPGGNCLTGCVATAMGQLLYYYRFPQQGQGSYSYTHPDYGTISADFGAITYNWNGMPSQITKDNDPVSELLFHQGVSVDMDYGPDASGMWNHKAAYSLKTFFRYGPETQYYFRDSVSIDWDSLLITNLDQRKPLYYAGWAGVQSTSGHAFVCDGYQPGNYYHFNWGWGGSQDGYFYTNNLTPGGNNFNFAQEVIPMFPDTIQNAYPSNCQGITTLNGLRGSIDDGSGWYKYQNNASCSWLISPQDIEYDSIKNIKITFLQFDTEAGVDSLIIYDGSDATAPIIGVYSGNSIPGAITSTGNKVFIEFHTNSTINKEGWQLDYESIFPVYCSGTTTLTATSGSIEDGSNERKYSSNSLCRWKIIPAGGMPVTFYFNTFETFDSIDIVKIYDLQTQEVLGTFSGNQIPAAVTAVSGKMMILFMTNNNGNAQGWSGEYYSSGVGIDETDSCRFESKVYPIPSSGNITIEKNLQISSEQVLQISVIDINGNTVSRKRVNAMSGFNKFSLDCSNLAPAEYLLIIEHDNEKEAIKIVIQE